MGRNIRLSADATPRSCEPAADSIDTNVLALTMNIHVFTTCIGELRRKMACEKHNGRILFQGANPTHPSVANPSPTQPERGRIPHPSAGRVVRDVRNGPRLPPAALPFSQGWAGGKQKATEPAKLRSVENMLLLTCMHVLHNMHRRTTPQNGMREA